MMRNVSSTWTRRHLLMTVSVVVLLAAAWVAPASAQVRDTGEPPAQSGDGFANFRTFCEFSHAAYDDPIVHPRDPGAAHLHLFFGNTRANAFTNERNIRRGTSTCQGNGLNRSAYWIPAPMDAGDRPRIPDGHDIYYKHLNDEPDDSVQILPQGLKIIAGSSHMAPGSASDVAYWTCDDGTYEPSATIPTCARGTSLRMTVLFPPCWDGDNLDSADHRSHMAYADFNARGEHLCPASHPVVVPQIIITFTWDMRDASSAGWTLSSDMGQPAGSTLHADWMNGWTPWVMNRFVAHCMNKTLDCAAGELGDGLQLDPTVPYGSRLIPNPPGADPTQYCNGQPATIFGTRGNDTIQGTPHDDVIVAYGGDDVIDGGGGNDVICAHAGDDTIRGGAGNDQIIAGRGDDTLFGGPGEDDLHGNSGNDQLEGENGNDALRGGPGNDRLTEFADENLLLGGPGNDVLQGGWWIDRMYGGQGNDRITGRGDQDRIWGGPGRDVCADAGRMLGC